MSTKSTIILIVAAVVFCLTFSTLYSTFTKQVIPDHSERFRSLEAEDSSLINQRVKDRIELDTLRRLYIATSVEIEKYRAEAQAAQKSLKAMEVNMQKIRASMQVKTNYGDSTVQSILDRLPKR